MTKTLIALGGSIESLPILRRAKELSHRLIVVDGNPNAAGVALADLYVEANCYNATHTVFALNRAQQKYDGVMCAAIDAPHVAAAVSAAFGLPGLSVEAAALGADKVAQVLALSRADIPVPRFFEPRDGFELDFGDWVVKPVDSRGARGVIRCNGKGIEQSFDHARSQSPTGRVMVEEWLDGPQLSTESLVQDGKVLFTAVGLRNYARLNEFAPAVVEDGFDEPYEVINIRFGFPSKTNAVNVLIEQSCAALGWFQSGGGVVKGDLVIHNGQLHVIELAPRLSGGLFCAAHELAYGVDFIGAAIELALGYTIDDRKSYARQFVSQRYIFPTASDIGKRITAQEENDYGAVFAHYSKPIGHVIQPVTAHPDRLGQALCVGATPQEARERAEQAVKEMYGAMVIE